MAVAVLAVIDLGLVAQTFFQPAVQNDEEEKIAHILIDTHLPQWNHEDHFNRSDVCAAIHIDHSDDASKSVEQSFERGVFLLDSDEFLRYLDKSIIIRGQAIKLKPKRYRPCNAGTGYRAPMQRDGTLVTIFGAYKRQWRHISSELFDDAFTNMEGIDVKIQTQPQYDRNTRTKNNNR